MTDPPRRRDEQRAVAGHRVRDPTTGEPQEPDLGVPPHRRQRTTNRSLTAGSLRSRAERRGGACTGTIGPGRVDRPLHPSTRSTAWRARSKDCTGVRRATLAEVPGPVASDGSITVDLSRTADRNASGRQRATPRRVGMSSEGVHCPFLHLLGAPATADGRRRWYSNLGPRRKLDHASEGSSSAWPPTARPARSSQGSCSQPRDERTGPSAVAKRPVSQGCSMVAGVGFEPTTFGL